MSKGKKFSPERLEKIRRLRKARRLYKQAPAFAFVWLLAEYPAYTYAEFLDDLRRRSKKKHRKGKSSLPKYGRYGKMMALVEEYGQTKDYQSLLLANQLRRNMTKPYRLLIKLKNCEMEFSLSPFIKYDYVAMLSSQATQCKTEAEIETMVQEFRKKHT